MNFVTRSEFREALLSLSKDIQKLQEAIHKSRKTKDVKNDPKGRVVLAKLDSVSSIETRTPHKEQKKDGRYQLWSLILAGLTLLAVGAYAVITGKMWYEMQTQTGIQGTAATNAERAWVGLDDSIKIDLLEVAPKLKVESHYGIKNFGHGPAFKVMPNGWFVDDEERVQNLANAACNAMIDFTNGGFPFGPTVKNHGPRGFILFPGGSRNGYIGRPDDPWQESGARPDLKHFWFIGCIAYWDQFKTTHWTRFCMEGDFSSQSIVQDIPLQFCALYNDTDESQTPRKK